ncbi:Internalin-A precursor [Thalassoglobus neptunius]|uniref:Internalin-A n=1 Tax=Thalassoglobus neptunius TaxID=1938619 RepID=A0A5C5WN29_9PLAN|nr:leucine-rich repeat domain-containing protein [Thalassoglobus neptunius]TWT52038.1 Internalin-A precursor [Thalassoglobus neptunius]
MAKQHFYCSTPTQNFPLPETQRLTLLLGCLTLSFTISGCSENPPSESSDGSASTFTAVKPEEQPSNAEDDTPKMLSADELRTQLGANENAHFEKTGRNFTVADLGNSGVTTLEPLRGLPLKVLNLSQTRVTDLSPLEGMKIERMGISETDISDMSPLTGAPLEHLDATRSELEDLSFLEGNTKLTHLYLEGAKVGDISPLKSCPLKVLWLNGCPVEDLSILTGKQLDELNLCDTPIEDLKTVQSMRLGTLWMRNTNVKDLTGISDHGLVSLDVEGSSVNNLNALSGMNTLKRLNISRTQVTDLSPLADLQLERLIFTPNLIKTGIEAIRNMRSLQQIDTSFDGVAQPMTPSEFWERYDAGEFKAES